MNSDEVNWLLQTIEDPENAKRVVQAQYQRGRIPYPRDGECSSGPELDGLACRRKTGCVDFNGVHRDPAKDSSCHGALTGTEVMEVLGFSTKAKEREFAAAPKHGDSIAFRLLRAQSANIDADRVGCRRRCARSISIGAVGEGAIAIHLVQHALVEL